MIRNSAQLKCDDVWEVSFEIDRSIAMKTPCGCDILILTDLTNRGLRSEFVSWEKKGRRRRS